MASNIKTEAQWIETINTCRTSGLSDKVWCNSNNIPISTFYNAVHRMRKRGYQIPVSQAGNVNIFDLTATTQDVVKVDIVDEGSSQSLTIPDSAPNIDNSYTMEILVAGATVRLSNDADPEVAGRIIRILGGAYVG